jgi:hypothetical protein
MPSRRQYLAATAGLGSAVFAGCFGGGSWKGLVVRNESESERTVTVTAEGDFQSQTVERTVAAGETAAAEEFVPMLDYDHVATITVAVDGTEAATGKRRVSTEVDEFTVVVTGRETARIEPRSAAVTTTTATPTPEAEPRSTVSRTDAQYVGDFVLWNDDDRQHTVSLTVRRGDETVLETKRTLGAGESADIPNPIERQGTYRIVVELEDGTEKRVDWPIESCANIEYRQVYVDDRGDVTVRTMRQTVDPPPTCT